MTTPRADGYDDLSPDELDALASREARYFYDSLEMRCKRFQPAHFIPTVTKLMREQIRKGKYVYAPVHQVAMMIEAVCAYTRGQNNDQLNWPRYVKIKNIFHDKKEPALHAAIKRGVDWFIPVMQREQLELQRGQSVYDVSNALDLYTDKNLADEMECELGMLPERWVSVSLAIWSIISKQEIVTIRPVINPEEKNQIALSENELKHVLSRLSRSSEEIGRRFKELRQQTAPKFHSHIRSTFVDKPFVSIGDGYCSPIPGVAFRGMFAELYRVARDCPSFDPAFSNAMEHVVEKTLYLIPEANRIWTNKEIEPRSHGRSCDFIVSADGYLLLVECKATSFTRDIVIPKIMENDGSTRKIQSGHIQIHQTCKKYRENGLDGLVQQRDVPVIGLVITFGAIPFSNAPWYYDRFIKDRVERKLGDQGHFEFAGRRIPFSLSLEMLQVLVVYLRDSGVTLLDAVHDYCSEQYVVTGDWDAYLEKRLDNESDSGSGLPFVRKNNGLVFSRILPQED